MSFLEDGVLLLDYRILKVLGSGGFGVTYLVRDEQLGRLFAIKEYFPSDFSFRNGVTVRARERREDDFAWGKERFVEEARVLARFDHPNIVKVIRVFDANNTSYMVQEYQSGCVLKQWAAGLDSPPTQTELDQLIAPLLDALSVVHRNGILHRDISPDNIYIRDDGTPVLIDFGSARQAVAQRTETVSAMVKSGFSPAEQYSTKGKGQGAWSDIYAFAATIYSVVTGSAPEQATERLLDDDYVPAKQAALSRGPYRESFLAAIDWALKLTPSQRPQSIEGWRPALLTTTEKPAPAPESAHRTGEPIGFPPFPPEQQPAKKPRNVRAPPVAPPNPAKILALVFATLAVFLAGAYIADQQKTVPVQQPPEQEVSAWNRTGWSDVAGLERFVSTFPNSQYRSAAEDRIRTLEQPAQYRTTTDKELKAWQNLSYDDQNALRAFVKDFPNSKNRSAVEDRIRTLEQTAQERNATDKDLKAWQNLSYDDQNALKAFVRDFPNSKNRSAVEDRIRTLEQTAQNKNTNDKDVILNQRSGLGPAASAPPVTESVTCSTLENSLQVTLSNGALSREKFQQALGNLREMEQSIVNPCKFGKVFGGPIVKVQKCMNDVTYVELGGSAGGPFVFNDRTQNYVNAKPSQKGQWLIGTTGPPYYCVASVTPTLVLPATFVSSMSAK